MKPVISHPKHSPKTTLVGFDYSNEGLPKPKFFAQQFISSLGYQVEEVSKSDKGIYDFQAFRGDPENDEFPDVRFFKIQLISRFYVSSKNKVGAQCGYRKLSDKQLEFGVEFLYVSPPGFCSFLLSDMVAKVEDLCRRLARK